MLNNQNDFYPALDVRVRIVCAILGLFLLATVFVPLKVSAGVYTSLLRFHVVANSDSVEDQEMKLAVRDLLLERTKEGLMQCADREEAAVYLAAQKGILLKEVRAFLRERGADYSAEATLVEEYHPKKSYEDVTLPQGNYLTFRVTLGEAEGKNFFCVLFPPICKNTVKKPASEVLVDYGVEQESVQSIVTDDGVSVRFFLWDALRGLFGL
ncbi:MAG: stage II sporulation protein R [Clostridia bacterium]|nr:stage II sporulation protein R [Clostridia bacterium]